MSNTSRTYASHRPVALYNNTVVHENLVVSTELVKVQSCQLREDITRTRPPPRHFLLLSLQSMPALLVVTSPSFSIEEVRVDRSSSSRSTCKTSQVHPNRVAPARNSIGNSHFKGTILILLHVMLFSHT